MMHNLLGLTNVAQAVISTDQLNADKLHALPSTTADDNAIRSVLNFVFVMAGAIAVLMVVIGGVRYIVSVGDPQKIATSKNTIIYAVVGLVMALSAFVIANFIFDAVSGTPTEESIGLAVEYVGVFKGSL